jgi:hypothetical protein
MPRHPSVGAGIATWQVGVVQEGARPDGHFEQGAKGVDGGAAPRRRSSPSASAPNQTRRETD